MLKASRTSRRYMRKGKSAKLPAAIFTPSQISSTNRTVRMAFQVLRSARTDTLPMEQKGFVKAARRIFGN
jgi:hypothetical protein